MENALIKKKYFLVMPFICLLILIDLDMLKPKMTSVFLNHIRFLGKIMKLTKEICIFSWKICSCAMELVKCS